MANFTREFCICGNVPAELCADGRGWQCFRCRLPRKDMDHIQIVNYVAMNAQDAASKAPVAAGACGSAYRHRPARAARESLAQTASDIFGLFKRDMRAALAFVAGLNLQDQPIAVQRQQQDVVRAIMKALSKSEAEMRKATER